MKRASSNPEYLQIVFYSESRLKSLLFYAACLGLFPFLVPLVLWYPQIYTRLVRRQVFYPSQAKYVLVRGPNAKWEEIAVTRMKIEANFYSTFEYRKLRYVLIGERFECVETKLLDVHLAEVHEHVVGLTAHEAQILLEQNGPNVIDLKPEPIVKMIVHKIFHPFYLFQIASVTIWFSNGYPLYAAVIAFLSLLSGTWEIYSAKKNESNMRKLVKVDHSVKVLRDGTVRVIDAKELVVGDAVIVETDTPVVCDMILVQGECVVDESSLTGETAPVVKTALPTVDTSNRKYRSDLFRPSTLFCGSRFTHVRQNPDHGPTIAVVMATGFGSTKGELFRSILHPREIDFKFNRQSYIFLIIMAVVALTAFTYKIIQGVFNQETVYNIVFNSLDLITVAVPPALPLVLSMGVGFSMSRLKKHRIFCINPDRINLAGWVDVVCWDKTGTLTEDNLVFQGVDCVSSSTDTFQGLTRNIAATKYMQMGIATCHSVNVVDGNIVGHFVDRELFKATGFTLKNYPDFADFGNGVLPLAARIATPEREYLILKRFDFDPHLQRASVLFASPCSQTGYSLFASVKGSPEVIYQICKKSSLPTDYMDVFKRYSSQGFYVLALAVKPMTQNNKEYSVTSLDPQRVANLSRAEIEQDLIFAGFVLFQSPIKKEAYSTIKKLVDANIKNIIITGDSALTAIHVTRQLGLAKRVLLIDRPTAHSGVSFCEIPTSSQAWSISSFHRPIEELPLVMKHCPEGEYQIAVNCHALNFIFDQYEDTFCNWLLENTIIFARAKPQDKTNIVEKMILLGHYTAMSGDGTNDCGALKAAHVGMALSDTEASIVAPFSSASKSVSDIPKLLAEGRCALETSFTAFKYMAVYPVVQLFASIVAYYYSSQMGNLQYLFDDLGIVFGLATFMLYTGPSHKLARQVPVKSLFSRLVLISLIGQIVINLGFSLCAFFYLKAQPWFCSAWTALAPLDLEDFTPKYPDRPYAQNYPCYYVDPARDVTYDTLISTYEATFPWVYGHFQYIGVAVAFCLSTTFRKPFWSNLYFVGWILMSFAACSFLLLSGHQDSFYESIGRWAFQFRDDGDVPRSFRMALFGLVILNMASNLLWEGVVVNGLVKKVIQKEQSVKSETKVKTPEMSVPNWRLPSLQVALGDKK